MMQTITTRSEETFDLGNAFAVKLRAGSTVALSGELGAGKTVFVRGVCSHFHALDQVSSPSFIIVNEYAGDIRIVHCDLYRLHGESDMGEIGLEELFASGALVLVEWAERAIELLPFPRFEVVFRHGNADDEREITIAEVSRGAESIISVERPVERFR